MSKNSANLEDLNAAELLALVDKERLPEHIAVIMDGNRRWAKEHHLPAIMGHKAGVKAFRRVMETCRNLGVRYLTAYAFSAENWRRAPAEVSVLMQLFEYYAKAERQEMLDTGIRFRTVGDLSGLSEGLRQEFLLTEEATSANSAMTLNLAVNYGSRAELVQACRRLAARVGRGELSPQDIGEQELSDSLWTAGTPDPDLLIRTSGELRISNFLLWQIAYTELWFSPIYWPEVDESTVYRAILAYQKRDRRYGGTT